MTETERVVVKTIIYSDIFDYPLTIDEIWYYLIGHTGGSPGEVEKALQQLVAENTIAKKGAWYCLPKRENVIRLRKERQEKSREKMVKARRVARVISRLPTVRCIGVTGGLSMQNADEKDDIDLFIITKKKTVWITRFLTLLVLEIMGVRRRRNERHVADKVCTNMFVDETQLQIPQKEQNLYTAHEITQLLPLYSTHGTYEKFLKENLWIKNFLPNASPRSRKNTALGWTVRLASIILAFPFIEFFAQTFQVLYMKEKKGKISRSVLLFYPSGFSEKVLGAYRKKTKAYETV